MGQRGQIAAGAYAALLRHNWMDAPIEHLAQHLTSAPGASFSQ
jgi:hypothetical protein